MPIVWLSFRMERLEYTAQITWRLRQAGMIRELLPDGFARLHDIFHGPVTTCLLWSF